MWEGGWEQLCISCWSMKSYAGKGSLRPAARGGRGQGGLGFGPASHGEPCKILGRRLAGLVRSHSSSGRNVALSPQAANFAVVPSPSNWGVSKGRQGFHTQVVPKNTSALLTESSKQVLTIHLGPGHLPCPAVSLLQARS